MCGDWIETEEETSLKNHLWWARVKVNGGGAKVPREVEIERDGYLFKLSIWSEILATVRRRRLSREEDGFRLLGNRGMVTMSEKPSTILEDFTSTRTNGHVGT